MARSALIVASARYADPELRQLRAPGSDAEALATVLRDPDIGGFDVRVLLDQPAHEIALAVEEFFADRHLDDLLLLHFSCHGVKDEEGELYFATTNTRLRRLGATAVSADFVNRRMNRSRCRRIVLLLDCCYAGAFERGMTARAGEGVGIEAQFGGRGRAVITASSAMEYAFEDSTLVDSAQPQPSVFTGALVGGLATGDADRDQDGIVSLDELYDYVYDEVRARTPNQTPSKWVFNVQGELRIARRARPVTTPAPLPPELTDAAASPFASVRAAAVTELSRLLHGRHAGLALAARTTLGRLCDDDSRTVAAAATAALAEVESETAPAGQDDRVAEPADELPGTAPAAGPADHDHETSEPVSADVPEPAYRLDTPETPEPDPASPPRTVPGSTAPQEDQGIPATEQPALSEQGSTPLRQEAAQSEASVPARPHRSAFHGEVRHRDLVSGTRPSATAKRSVSAEVGFLVAGGLAILASVLHVVAVFPVYTDTLRMVDTPTTTMSIVINSLGSFAGGVLLLLRGTRLFAGPGFILGVVVTAPNAYFYGFHAMGRTASVGAGLWLDLTTATILVVCAGVVVWAVVRVGMVRFRRPDTVSWLLVLCGGLGAVAVFFETREQSGFRPEVDLAPLVLASVMALVVPAVAGLVTPRRFAGGMLAGWLVYGAGLVVFREEFGNFGYTLLLLLAISVGIWSRRQDEFLAS